MEIVQTPTLPELFTGKVAFWKTAAVLLIAAFALQLVQLRPKGREKVAENDYPWGLSYHKYLPRWMSGAIYSRYALETMEASYKRHSHKPYKLVRNDIDMIILPESVVNELAGLPNEIASNILALQFDLVGRWTGLSMLKESSLHMRVVHRRITPNLARLTPELEEEVSDGIRALFPQKSGEWVEIEPYPVMMKIASRVFSRVVVGPQFCRDDRWLEFSMNFTENVFNSLVFIRYFPPWMYPILRYTLPSVRKSIQNIRQAEELLVPEFDQLLKKHFDGTDVSSGSTEHNGLHWLTEIADGDERDPIKLVHAQILLALGAIHTSLFSEINILYDLISNPPYIQEVRAEVQEEVVKGWDVNSYSKLYKLDSILRESQRMSPPFLTGLRRVMKKDHVFSNGVLAPRGSYVCVPTYSISNNLHTYSPSLFDGLRSYNLKINENALNSTKHQFTTTESSVLGFGHGRTACPGRFLAGLALKVIFTKLLVEYDIKFAGDSRRRPPNKFAHEIVFPDPTVKIWVRRRDSISAPF